MPTTEAGKALLAAKSYHWQLCGLNIGEDECDCSLPESITAIEEEAAKPLHLDPKDNERCDGHCAANECVCPEGGWEAEADRLRLELDLRVTELRGEIDANNRLQQTIDFLDKKMERLDTAYLLLRTASKQCSGSPKHFGGCGCLCHNTEYKGD